jgi:hypothetical protein
MWMPEVPVGEVRGVRAAAEEMALERAAWCQML